MNYILYVLEKHIGMTNIHFSSNYRKLFTCPCAVSNVVRLGSPSVRSYHSQVRRVVYVTWHVGQCLEMLLIYHRAGKYDCVTL